MAKSFLGSGLDDAKMNSHLQRTLEAHRKPELGDEILNEPVHKAPPASQPTGPMKGPLMTWTQLLEAMDEISDALPAVQTDVSQTEVEPADGEDVMKDLNDIFTPVLVTQGLESDIADKAISEYESADVLTERNIIKFDDKTRMAQLISVCALLIAKKKNSPKYQTYAKAAKIRNQMKLEIQKEEYAEAKALAQKFLVKVATTNNSSVARNAANKLLPQTQH